MYFRRRTPRSSLRHPHASSQRPALERPLGSPLIVETPIITVKEARKLWGSGARAYSDDEIRTLIRDYETLARQAVRAYLVR